jgi:hypothetical protein
MKLDIWKFLEIEKLKINKKNKTKGGKHGRK